MAVFGERFEILQETYNVIFNLLIFSLDTKNGKKGTLDLQTI